MAKLNKPVLGIDQLSNETGLIHDSQKHITAVRKATNIDLDVAGNASRRKGYTLKIVGEGYHSLYESKRGWLMACKSHELGVYTPETNIFAVITNMASNSLTSFAELNGNIYYVNPGHKGLIRVNEAFARPLGESLPDVTPSFTAVPSGSLPAGTYGIAYSVVNNIGEESPLGMLVTVELTGQSSIQGALFTIAPGYSYRIYMTTADGEELYQAAEFDADTANFLISDHEIGRRPATQNLSQLPFGYIIEAHKSRLYIATEDFVFYSEAFMPHLTNAAHNFLPTTGFTTMVQPVERGIFIGDQTGVRFYAGDDPAVFEPKTVSSEVPIFGTSIAVPGEYLPEEFASADISAVWLTQSGYYIGLPSGDVVRLHSKQVALPRYVQGCAAFAIQDGRKQVITPVNSNVLADASVALDSTIV
jgi:hypothetical protein